MKVSLSKSDMAKLHDSGKVEKDGVEIEFVQENETVETKEPFKGIQAFALSESFNDWKTTKDNPLLEGQFSWMTHDTGDQIGSEPANKITTYMFDDKGNSWEERDYEGYGEFGGMDYYELVAKMNGYDEKDLEDKKLLKKAKVIGKPELRQIGIAIAFDKLKPKTGKKVLFPALVTTPKYNWKRHDFTQEAEPDPNQSWYVEPEYDDYDDDDYGY